MKTALLFAWLACAATAAKTPTWSADVAPILYRNCVECHRTGEAAPMAFTSYGEARPWAKAIHEAVASKRMPPWFADPAHGKFRNERKLSDSDIATIAQWVAGGSPEGNRKKSPKPPEFEEGWAVGKPDAVFEMPVDYAVKATGEMEYQYIIIPTGFTEDKWVEKIEFRPGNRGVVHHIIAFARKPGDKYFREKPVNTIFVPRDSQEQRAAAPKPTAPKPAPTGPPELRPDLFGVDYLGGFAPGTPPDDYGKGRAKLIPAGSDIVLQLHYTANGAAGLDRSKVGFVFAKEPVTERVQTLSPAYTRLKIPAGDPAHTVKASTTIRADVTLTELFPHMHLRGKSFEFVAEYPTGEKEVLLNVPRYDFNWQLTYRLAAPKLLPKGTKIHLTAVYDNSANNKANPDPSKEVRWGDQSWEEMMIGFLNVTVDPKIDPAVLTRAPRPASSTD